MAPIFTMGVKKNQKEQPKEPMPWELYNEDGSLKSDPATAGVNPWDLYNEDGSLRGPDPNNIDDEEITPYELRMRTGALNKSEDRLTVIRKFYPDAIPYGDDNFIFTDPATGKTHMYNQEGWIPSVGDFVSILPETAEVTGSILGGIGGFAAGTAIGSPSGPGAVIPAVGGAVTGAGFGGATAKDLSERLINWGYGDLDTGTTPEYLKDKAVDFGVNALGEGAGRAIIAGAKPALRTGQRLLFGGPTDTAAAQQLAKEAEELGLRPTLGIVNQNPKTLVREATLMADNPNGVLARTVKELDEGIGGKVQEISTGIFAQPTSKDSVGTLLKDATKKASDSQLTKLKGMYDEVDNLAGGQKVGNTSIDQVVKSLEAQKKALGQTEKLTKGPTLDNAIKYAKAVNADAKKGLTFRQAKDIRTDINALAYGAKEDPYSKTLFQPLADALKGDMTTAAKGLSDDAFTKWQTADAAYSEWIKKGGTKKLLEKGVKEAEPTKVFDFYSRQITKAPQSLKTVRDTLSKEGGEDAWNAFVSHHVAELGQQVTKEGKVFNPTVLTKQLAKMPKEAKEVLFSGANKSYGEDLEKLSRLAAARAVQKGTRKETPNQITQLIRHLIPGSGGAYLGGPAGIAAGLAVQGANRFVVQPINKAVQQRMLTNPAVVRELAGLGKLEMEKNGWQKATARLREVAVKQGLTKEMDELLGQFENDEE